MKPIQKKHITIYWVIRAPRGDMNKRRKCRINLKWSHLCQGQNGDDQHRCMKKTSPNLTRTYSSSQKSVDDASQSPNTKSSHVSGLLFNLESATMIIKQKHTDKQTKKTQQAPNQVKGQVNLTNTPWSVSNFELIALPALTFPTCRSRALQ